jgi:hypothetical protein
MKKIMHILLIGSLFLSLSTIFGQQVSNNLDATSALQSFIELSSKGSGGNSTRDLSNILGLSEEINDLLAKNGQSWAAIPASYHFAIFGSQPGNLQEFALDGTSSTPIIDQALEKASSFTELYLDDAKLNSKEKQIVEQTLTSLIIKNYKNSLTSSDYAIWGILLKGTGENVNHFARTLLKISDIQADKKLDSSSKN